MKFMVTVGDVNSGQWCNGMTDSVLSILLTQQTGSRL